jgi:hypothetical protein
MSFLWEWINQKAKENTPVEPLRGKALEEAYREFVRPSERLPKPPDIGLAREAAEKRLHASNKS